MARRRRQNDDWWIGPIFQLAGLIVLAAMLIPSVRQKLLSIGMIALVLIGLVAVCYITLGIRFFLTRDRERQPEVEYTFTDPAPVFDGAWNRSASRPRPIVKAPPATELVEQLRSIDWFQFEKLVGHLYRKLGYTVTRRGGANPDGGIDLIVEKDGQSTAIQCKQWKTWNVGVKPVREFLGALMDAGIQSGIFITLRGYTGEARQLAEKHGIEIVNEVGLTQLLESVDARFDPEVLELLRDERKFCPKCECELVVRVAKRGPNPGSRFWGCSGYPRCHYKMPMNSNQSPLNTLHAELRTLL